MKKKKKKEKDYGLSIRIGILILFIYAFIALISKQQENNLLLGDIIDNEFYLRTVPTKQLVVRDMEAIYPRYYVFFFDNTDSTYIVHSYNYYQTDSQYELEFNNHLKYLVDYNYGDYMIRYVYGNGEGNYYDVIENLPSIIDSVDFRIY